MIQPSAAPPSRPARLRELLRFVGQRILWSHSPFAREIIQAPGSWRCLDHIYRNAPSTWLDRRLLTLAACQGTLERLHAYRRLLGDAVEVIHEEPIRLLDLGSGPGWAPLDLVASSPRTIAVTCVDRAADAIEAGRALADRRGLAHAVSFQRDNIRRFAAEAPAAAFHVVGTHGVLDYFTGDDARVLLAAIGRLLVPGGVLVTSNMCHHRDRIARFLMEFFGGWRLHYRDEHAVAHLLEAAGYGEIETRITAAGFHLLATGRRPTW